MGNEKVELNKEEDKEREKDSYINAMNENLEVFKKMLK